MNSSANLVAQQPISVSSYLGQLNRALLVQRGRIKGEVTSVSPSGRAVYFTIKDKNQSALLNCMIWLNIYQTNGIKLEIGNEIIVTGTPDIYAPTGRLSLKVTTIEYAGEGALKQAYDKLKAALKTEGLLELSRKRPMPEFPKKIGLITSMSSGVVIEDFNLNLNRHGYKIMTCDSKVEGKEAVHDLLASIRTMAKKDIDILVIIRGGGSMESLQAFNTESVVRAIAGFKTPVITGIGHAVDMTLAQLVADIGKSTPTAVAEAFNEQWEGLENTLNIAESKTLGRFRIALDSKSRFIVDARSTVFRTFEQRLFGARTEISNASATLTSLFHGLSRRVRDANAALQGALGIMKAGLKSKAVYLNQVTSRLADSLKSDIAVTRGHIKTVGHSVTRQQKTAIRLAVKELPRLQSAIAINDPMRNIKLGYSLSYVNGKLARQVSDIAVGDVVTTNLVDGEFTSRVKKVR